ncbi:MAG TPA: pyridoxal-phosphate dependent enzyme, partial [Gammaproteobacteria bacterium]|nr:pyridoxal-phosphate dependent enzyme [Gammaproteobacteria bacterium]
MAGQGTIGLEIMDECPGVDTVVVPVGGGGLISGVAAAVKGASPGVRVMGVEAAASASLKASFEAGRPTEVEKGHTIADGIAVKKVGEKPFAVIRRLVEGAVTVGEDSIAGGILTLLERKKLVVEGSGAAPVAAAMEGLLPTDARNVVMVLSGGNIDVNVLDRIIRLGLIREGRVVRLATVLADEPGSLARLTADIAGLRGNILHIVHQRDAMDAPVGTARLEAIVEVEGPEHGRRLVEGLRDRGYEVSEGG